MAFPLAGKTGGNPQKNIPKAQDLHCMLDKIFKSYVELQDSGFFWDFRTKMRCIMASNLSSLRHLLRWTAMKPRNFAENLRHKRAMLLSYVGIAIVQQTNQTNHL